jgi:hypothetical protein
MGRSSMCEGVARILLDSLLKVFDRLVESVFGPPVPLMQTL